MNSLIDFDGVGEVLVNLTNKLADAAGWIANRQTPYKIAVDTYIEEIKRSNLDSLTKACLISNAKKIIKEYSNQNEIFAIATESICETAKPNMVENDWVSQFMDKAKLISDREFQLIWGRILAEECNCPNSIPKMLLHILEQMDKNDATAFSLICSFAVWMKDDENKIEYYPIIDSLQLEKFYGLGLTLNALVDLQALGLIEMSFDDGSYCYFSEDKKKRVVINYYDHTYELPEGMSTCSVGNIVFTKAGQALCKAIIVEEQKGFWENECLPIWEKEVKIFLLEQSKEKKNEQ